MKFKKLTNTRQEMCNFSKLMCKTVCTYDNEPYVS